MGHTVIGAPSQKGWDLGRITCYMLSCAAPVIFINRHLSKIKNHSVSSANKSLIFSFDSPRLLVCRLTEASCENLMSVLTSNMSQLCVLDLRCNQIGDQGFIKLCEALHSPRCKLQELLYVLSIGRFLFCFLSELFK